MRQRTESQQQLFQRRRQTATTSQAARASIAEHLPVLRQQVLDFIARQGAFGATREEIGIGIPARLQSICPVVLALLHEGKLRKIGTRETTSGRLAAVYVVVVAGPATMQPGPLVQPALPAAPRASSDRALLRSAAAEENMRELRRDAAAGRIISAGRRAGKSDDEIRKDLETAGLEWPK